MIQRKLERKHCGQRKPKLSSLASTQLAVFGDGEMQSITQRTPSPQLSMVETYFGADKGTRGLEEPVHGIIYHKILD